jgi:GTPase SAR1 family protein
MANLAREDSEKIKLLLLGAGESGKSTIFKQMKVIYGEQYSEAERKQQLPTIYCNVLQAMKVLIEQAVTLNMVDGIKAKNEFNQIRGIDENEVINVSIGDAIKALWADPGIQAVWGRRSEFQIIESVQFYFNKIDQIKLPDYLPDKDDILYSRVRTSGIVTERYKIDGSIFEMYDVGGQRNERKKWIHCFEGVTAVIFVAALSEYDQKLFEDASTNRMVLNI